MEASVLRIEKFRDIALTDPFFDTLKSDYSGFAIWFANKANNDAVTFRAEGGGLEGFLYLKEETGPVADVQPNLLAGRRLKIGTFKINPHGTRLGERFMKRAFDTAVDVGAEALYVTVFEKHEALIQLFTRYGFVKVGKKSSGKDEDEAVYERRLDQTESPRVLRRLHTLRRWSHEQEIKSFFTRGSRTRCPHGARTPRRVPLPMGHH